LNPPQCVNAAGSPPDLPLPVRLVALFALFNLVIPTSMNLMARLEELKRDLALPIAPLPLAAAPVFLHSHIDRIVVISASCHRRAALT
jgi:hypothetical protein